MICDALSARKLFALFGFLFFLILGDFSLFFFFLAVQVGSGFYGCLVGSLVQAKIRAQ